MFTKYKYITPLAFLLFSLCAMAQKEPNNWFYGVGQGITWNVTQTVDAPLSSNPDGPKTTLEGIPTRYESQSVRPTPYPINTVEGCFALSDKEGNLLFYSDGSTIWNKNHNPMVNGTGLHGHKSSAQSGIIIPYPGHPNQYVALSIGVQNRYNVDNESFHYSIIDMTEEGGLGKVIIKNVPMVAADVVRYYTESVTSVRKANGTDYWIIATKKGGNNETKLVAWSLTSTGIDTANPVESTAVPYPVETSFIAGYLKLSPSAKYFAWMLNTPADFFYGKFDNATGKFSEIKSYKQEKNITTFSNYGAEFSVNEKWLYVGRYFPMLVDVFDFEKLRDGSDLSPVKTFNLPGGAYIGALQLATDERLYVTNSGDIAQLHVIDKPNDPLQANAYRLEGLSGPYAGGNFTTLGLPTFSPSWFAVEGTKTVCLGEEAEYKIELAHGTATLVVDFDEGNGPERFSVVGQSTYLLKYKFKQPKWHTLTIESLDAADQPITEGSATLVTEVYSCVLPVNHNLTNVPY